MLALDNTYAHARRFIRKLRGGSQPVLVEGSDGFSYVLKFTNNLQGANLPFNESMGAELFRACGLPVPMWKPLLLTHEFVDQTPECWINTSDGKLRPEPGICFGSRFLGRPNVRLLEILPGANFARVQNRIFFWLAWLVDICCEHTDNRQALFVEDLERRLHTWFIDMGHLFGGPKGDQKPRHFIQPRFLDPRIYTPPESKEIAGCLKSIRSLDADALWRASRSLPEGWLSVSAMRAFFRGLDALANANLVENVLQMLIAAQTEKIEPFPVQPVEQLLPAALHVQFPARLSTELDRPATRRRRPACH
jgi:hypothetical protein